VLVQQLIREDKAFYIDWWNTLYADETNRRVLEELRQEVWKYVYMKHTHVHAHMVEHGVR